MREASRSLLVVPISIVLGVAVLLLSVYALRVSASAAFEQEVQLRATRSLATAILQEQVDEESGVRGFEIFRQVVYLEPYSIARPLIGRDLGRLSQALADANLPANDAVQAAAITARWDREVARPVIRSVVGEDERLKLGKLLVDVFRVRMAAVLATLDQRQTAVDQERSAALNRIGLVSTLTIVVLAAVAFLFVRRQRHLERLVEAQREAAERARGRAAEMRAAYEAEKRIADTLQDAIAQRPLPLHPMLRFSATYVPATDESRVGGDWYDAIELPNNRVLFAIGDVTGHGLPAAVTMSRARQALITSALYDSEPANVLARVNDELVGQNAPMVTAVAGFADARTYEFVYASAGHPPPVLLEPNRPPRLLSFGGVPLGVVGSASYDTHRIQSVPGAMLVLYTDGALEHTHDVIEGEMILLASVARAGEIQSDDTASVIHDEIFHGTAAGDDVAILTIGFSGSRSGALRISVDDAQTSVSSRIERDAPYPGVDGASSRAAA